MRAQLETSAFSNLLINACLKEYSSVLRAHLRHRQHEASITDNTISDIDESIRLLRAYMETYGFIRFLKEREYHIILDQYASLMISDSLESEPELTPKERHTKLRKEFLNILVLCGIPIDDITLTALPPAHSPRMATSFAPQRDGGNLAAFGMFGISKNPDHYRGYIALGTAFSYGKKFKVEIEPGRKIELHEVLPSDAPHTHEETLYGNNLPRNVQRGRQLFEKAVALGGNPAREDINFILEQHKAFEGLRNANLSIGAMLEGVIDGESSHSFLKKASATLVKMQRHAEQLQGCKILAKEAVQQKIFDALSATEADPNSEGFNTMNSLPVEDIAPVVKYFEEYWGWKRSIRGFDEIDELIDGLGGF